MLHRLCIRYYFLFLHVAVLAVALLVTSNVSAGKQTQKIRDDSPTFFILYSANGNEKFQAECNPKTQNVVKCDFVGTRIKDPVKVLSEYERLSDKDKKEAQADFSKRVRSKDEQEMIEKMQLKLLDPSVGPKTKAMFKSMISAYQGGDFSQLSQVMIDRENRTCQVFVQSFYFEFKKIGLRKWLSNPEPGGRCKILKIYELTEDEEYDLWQMTETRVTAGSTEGPCQSVGQELNKPTVWTWKNPSEYELSCDFLKFDVFLPH
jgi:hypothetical protein